MPQSILFTLIFAQELALASPTLWREQHEPARSSHDTRLKKVRRTGRVSDPDPFIPDPEPTF